MKYKYKSVAGAMAGAYEYYKKRNGNGSPRLSIGSSGASKVGSGGSSGSFNLGQAIEDIKNIQKLLYRNRRNGSAYSGGFFSKTSKKILSDIQKYGVICNSEIGGGSGANHMVVIGHATFPRMEILKAACRAAIKAFSIKLEKPMESIDQTVPDSANGDVWEMSYKNIQSGAMTNVTFFPGVGQYTWSQVIDALFVAISGITVRNVEFNVIAANFASPNVESVIMPLKLAKVYIHVKSSLKIQNRTQGEETDATGPYSEDRVDQTPLYGKSYYGRGTGTAQISRGSFYSTDESLYAGSKGGIIKSDDTEPGVPREPWLGHELANVTGVGKVHLEPGQIKTSVLTDSLSLYWNQLIYIVLGDVVNYTTASPHKGPGKFKMFAFEKMLEDTPNAPTRSIAYAYQVDYRIGSVMFVGKTYRTQVADVREQY